MATRTKKIKQWVIDAVVENVKAGRTTLESIDDADLLRKVRSAMVASPKSDPVRLTGRITRDSGKAVFFVPIADGSSSFDVGSCWWPKSQIEIYERSMGPCDQIDVPEWLLKKKMAS